MESIATLCWGAVLASQDGLATAADWKIDFGNEAPLPDFIAAYQPLVEGLRREGVSSALLQRLAFDPVQFKDVKAGQRDAVIRAALRTRGLILRDRISDALYRRAAPFARPEEAADKVRRALRAGSAPTPAPLPVAEAPRAQKQNHRPQPPAASTQTMIDAIHKSEPNLYKKIGKKLNVSNLAGRLAALVEDRSENKRVRNKALLYMIQGLETSVWRFFKIKLDQLVFQTTELFTAKHIEALQRLDREETFAEIREEIRHLLDILERRRGPAAGRRLNIRSSGPS